MGVLVTLTGAAPGCGYDNPGFKLRDSDPVTSTDESTTNISGAMTMTTEPGTTNSATPTTSTADASTSNGSQVSGTTETTETTEDLTTSTSSTTTGMPAVEWPPCTEFDETKPSKAKLAAADTFLLKEIESGQLDCGIEPAKGQCRDLNLGATEYFELYFDAGGDPLDPKDDTASVFAVRFDAPDPPMHENLLVPQDSVIGVRVTIHLVRPFPNVEWSEPTFNVFGLHAEAIWPEGGGAGPTPCMDPGASFRCSQCKTGPTCLKPWIGVNPFPADVNEGVASFTLVDEPPGEGVDVALDFPIEALEWLTENGLVIVPETGTKKGTIEVKARDYDMGKLGPFIQYLYCPPIIP